MRRFILLLFLVATGCSGPLRASISPAELYERVRNAEGRRDAHHPAVAKALGRQERSLRIAGLAALARTEAVGTSSLAKTLVGDRDATVASWAAFALGQIRDEASTAVLLDALETNLSPVPKQVVLALGRAGTATTARMLIPYLKDERPQVRGAAALSIGLIAKRDLESLAPATFVPVLAPLTSDADRDVRFGATYALMYFAAPSGSVALIRTLADADAEVRAHAVRGLGEAGAAPQILDAVMSDPDWRVRTELARALGAIGAASENDASAAALRLGALGNKSFARFRRGDALAAGRATHVLLAVADAAAKIPNFGRKVLEQLDAAPWNIDGLAEASAPDVARVQCRVAFLLDRIDGEIKRVRTCGKDTLPEWRRSAMIAKLHAKIATTPSLQALANLSAVPDAKVRAAAVEAIGEIATPQATAVLAQLLLSNDPYVASASAEILARPERANLRPKDLATSLGTALERTLADGDPSVVVLVLDAIGALGPAADVLVDDLVPLDRHESAAIRRRAAQARAAIVGRSVAFRPAEQGVLQNPLVSKRVKLKLETIRGTVVIELYGEVAPQTTGTLVALTKAGFYDDKTFHRIVSNFVVQGGCPRGDGWGGPGYVIRDETSPLPFVRGAVGIATNGRDTGGSQIFVMHAHHPHLEGGYTLVGHVLEGIAVVDALQSDDRILKATIEP